MTALIRIAALVLMLAGPAMAEVARVSGGEHSDFTRLVVEGSAGTDWALGRAADGYELRMAPSVASYDVTNAFDKIPRNRLAALWQDPETGRLRFSLACACHAIAFEFRPGVIVIDIKSGPAPGGSAFELPLSGSAATDDPVESSPSGNPPSVAPYDWVALQREKEAKPSDSTVLLPLPTGGTSLDPLRDALLSQISKGASEGVIDIAEGIVRPDSKDGATDAGPWSRLAVGELPGLSTGDGRTATGSLTVDGKTCPPDREFDIAAWGNDGPVATQLGLARSGLLTEFDAPVEDAVLRSVRFHIFLGFGAEARQILGFLPKDQTDVGIFLDAMARLVDEETPEDNPFAGMESCDTAVAVWAVLAAGRSREPPALANTDAVVRAFSALPVHLRRQLGGALVDMFIAGGDHDTARKLRDAAQRLPLPDDPELSLLEAKFQLAEGDEAMAQDLAEDVMAQAGPMTTSAAVTLVEAAFRGSRSIDPKLPSAIEVFLRDASGQGSDPALSRAAVLAHAMVGDFASAFALEAPDPATLSDLWSIAVEQADDAAFLAEAARSASDSTPIRAEVETEVAKRLMQVGMADLALAWLGEVHPNDPEDRRLVAASALLAVRDAPGALAVLEGLSVKAAEKTRALAKVQLGDTRSAVAVLAEAGEVDQAQRTAVWTQDWSFVREAGPEIWKDALGSLIVPTDPTGQEAESLGAIARGNQLVEESEKSRATIEGLLIGTIPTPPGQ
jgi:hypothetical protein